ncbi:MAG: 2-amino-4-hydroxy-6-hydroxymethyldihydropteridine diphosphokinase, partial [Thiothrix lacustris]
MNSVTAYIGLGSNLGDPAANLHSAIAQLAGADGIALRGVSRFYVSKPMGPQDQPDYVNAVICVFTPLDAHTLLQRLFAVERAHGRVRDASQRWGARTLDLDLLLYGDQVIATPDLHVPHPGIGERSFVLLPLADLAPHQVFPDG